MTLINSRLVARLTVLSVAVVAGLGPVGSSAHAAEPADPNAASSIATDEGLADGPDDFPLDDGSGPDEPIDPDPEDLPDLPDSAVFLPGSHTPFFRPGPGGFIPFAQDCGGAPDQTWRSWKNVGSNPVVTHASAFENDGDTPLESTETVEKQTVITAGAEVTVGVTATAKALVGELSKQASLKIQASGAWTTKTSVQTKISVPKHSHYVYFRGTIKVAGKFTEYQCKRNRLTKKGTGSARSWTVNTTGQANCAKTPKKALAKLAKKENCY